MSVYFDLLFLSKVDFLKDFYTVCIIFSGSFIYFWLKLLNYILTLKLLKSKRISKYLCCHIFVMTLFIIIL